MPGKYIKPAIVAAGAITAAIVVICLSGYGWADERGAAERLDSLRRT
jgi:hypothetical protein